MLEWLTKNRKGLTGFTLALWLLSVFACGFGGSPSSESSPTVQAAPSLFLTAPDLCCHDGQHAPVLESARLAKARAPLAIVMTVPAALMALFTLAVMVVATRDIRAGPRERRFRYFPSVWPQAPPL